MDIAKEYFTKLRTKEPLSNDAQRANLRAMLDRAYAQRSFEIEHFWKRGTFFWGFQIVVFAAFGVIWKDLKSDAGYVMLLALTAVGLLSALANSFAGRGSKFWQENWEKHIEMLEDVVEGPLYKTVWLRQGQVEYSVTGLSIALSNCFVGFWLFAGLFVAVVSREKLLREVIDNQGVLLLTIVGVIGVIIAAFALSQQRTKIRGALYAKHNDNVVEWPRVRSITNEASFVVRHLPSSDR
ncbi:hypothetical protein [Rhodopseudomonas sp. BR0G17]|uniref:RipA family octameric membrane protein n=1 Tax=Rhodopseudomonas sp. BR0G17 TaxID=2269368 RepID=UPI0013E03E5D|nr:hypothetical protein [Rhodopseudomonas sp. BR0G17]